MAKYEEASKQPTEAEINSIIKALKNDIDTFRKKAEGELFVNMIQNNGNIDLKSGTFQQFKESFLNADPHDSKNAGKAVISLLATEKSLNKKIDDLIKRGADPRLFEGVQAEARTLRTELEKGLASKEGVQGLILDLAKRRALEQAPFLVLITEDQGMYKKGDVRGMSPIEKAEMSQKLWSSLDMPPNILKPILKSGKVNAIEKMPEPIVQRRMLQFFAASQKVQGADVLDPAKLTSENIQQFGKTLKADLAAHPVLEKALKIAQEKGVNLDQEGIYKVKDRLAPTLSKVEAKYLEKNIDKIVEELAYGISKSKTVKTSRYNFIKIIQSLIYKNHSIPTKELDKIAQKLEANHLPKVQQESVAILQDNQQEVKTKKPPLPPSLKEGISPTVRKQLSSAVTLQATRENPIKTSSSTLRSLQSNRKGKPR